MCQPPVAVAVRRGIERGRKKGVEARAVVIFQLHLVGKVVERGSVVTAEIHSEIRRYVALGFGIVDRLIVTP